MEHDEMLRVLTETEARSKSNTKRIDKLEESTDALNRLATSVEIIANEQKRLAEDFKEAKQDLETLKEKPGKLGEKLVEYGLCVLVGAIITYLIGGIL